MKETAYITGLAAILPACVTGSALLGCAPHAAPPVEAPPLEVVDRENRPRPPYAFDVPDAEFLDRVQRGAFLYLWEVADPATGMVFDRSSAQVISVAGVGFQLSAIPVGIERGWISREQGLERTARILTSLAREPANRKGGMFYHYLEAGTARPTTKGYETVVSTIDSAILLSGMITVSSYFGGAIAKDADAMIAAVDWAYFVEHSPSEPWAKGFISLGWKPADIAAPTGNGSLLPYYWADAGDEQKLVTLLAVSAPEPSKRVPPATYFRLRRQLGTYADSGLFVWFPWSGALFTNFFAHCWIDYAHAGPDDPAAFGVPNRPRVDWWENARRAVIMHRRKAVENPRKLPTLGEDAWGLGAHDAAGGYVVNHLFPAPVAWPGAREGADYPRIAVKDQWGDGTVAPYNAGCAVLFEPRAATAALRHYAEVKDTQGHPLVWREPAVGSYGFQDAFNLGTGWCAPDCVAIDQGPMILCIENARTGLIWKLFSRHPSITEGVRRVGLNASTIPPSPEHGP